MWNPARELLEMIDSWDGSHSLIIGRGEPTNDDSSVVFWETQATAVRLLLEVEEFLRDDGSYEEDAGTLVEIWQELFPPRNDWCSSGGFPRASRGTRSALRQIARRMDSENTQLADLSPELLGELRQTLEELLRTIQHLPNLQPADRDWLVDLIRRALRIIEDEPDRPDKIKAATCEVAGATLPVLSTAPEEERRGIFEKIMRIAGTWIMSATAGTAGNLLTSGAATLLPQLQ